MNFCRVFVSLGVGFSPLELLDLVDYIFFVVQTRRMNFFSD